MLPLRKKAPNAPTVQRVPNTLRERKALQLSLLALDDYPEGHIRPRTRGDCAGQARPCPWVSCRHHLYLEVSPKSGSLKLNHPDLEPWELADSCSLDVADRAALTLAEVAEVLALTKQRIEQVQLGGLQTLRIEAAAELGPEAD